MTTDSPARPLPRVRVNQRGHIAVQSVSGRWTTCGADGWPDGTYAHDDVMSWEGWTDVIPEPVPEPAYVVPLSPGEVRARLADFYCAGEAACRGDDPEIQDDPCHVDDCPAALARWLSDDVLRAAARTVLDGEVGVMDDAVPDLCWSVVRRARDLASAGAAPAP